MKGAIEDYTLAIKFDPGWALAYDSRGIAKMDQHDLDGAILMPTGQIAILFESQRRYQLAFFDRASLAPVKQMEVSVPVLK